MTRASSVSKIDGEFTHRRALRRSTRSYKHDIEVVVDRVVVAGDLSNRLADSIETALSLTDGLVIARDADTATRRSFSPSFACPVSGFTIEEIEPRLFSFNNPFGACPPAMDWAYDCYFDPELVVPDEKSACGMARRTLGAIASPVLRADAGSARRTLQEKDRPLERSPRDVRSRSCTARESRSP